MNSTTAEAFACRVEAYVAGRPDYPLRLLADLPLAGARLIVDLGAGTGKLTRLLARSADSRTRIVAVEPLAEMAERIIPDDDGAASGIEVLPGRAEVIPLPAAGTDLICCAQAFHWFDYERATAQIHRVLRESGHLALIWNVRDPRPAWMAALSALFDRHAGDTPRHATGRWRAIFRDERFRHLRSAAYEHVHRMPMRGIFDRVLSVSFIAALPEAAQQQVRAEVARILAADATLAGQEEVDFPYVAELHLFQRRP